MDTKEDVMTMTNTYTEEQAQKAVVTKKEEKKKKEYVAAQAPQEEPTEIQTTVTEDGTEEWSF